MQPWLVIEETGRGEDLNVVPLIVSCIKWCRFKGEVHDQSKKSNFLTQWVVNIDQCEPIDSVYSVASRFLSVNEFTVP
jgi:hypothetical protein